MRFEKQADILAQHSAEVFQTMANTKVMGVKVRADERIKSKYAVAVLVPFEHLRNKIKGNFILGFQDERMAMFVAAAIAENLGAPPVNEFDETAEDVLNEFVNTIIGHTYRAGTPWVQRTLRSTRSSRNALVQTISGLHTEAYVVVLQLVMDHIVLSVTFNEDEGKKTARPSGYWWWMIPPCFEGSLPTPSARRFRGRHGQGRRGGGCRLQAVQSGPDPDGSEHAEMGGLDTIMSIRQFCPQAKFVVMTSSSRKDEVVTAKTLKVLSYLIKPVNPQKLMEVIGKVLS